MKGHGAADWSKRPLPADWLNYAALDVEVLLELRAAVAAVLDEQGKTEWAEQEFEHLRTFVAPPTRRDRWRRTSGIHKVRNPQDAGRRAGDVDDARPHRAAARHRARPHPARRRDHQRRDRRTRTRSEKLTALPVFGGSRQRRSAQVWLDALARARTTDDLPTASEPQAGPPPASRWSRRKPEAAARLEAARTGLAELSQRFSVPTENLLTPDTVRRLCWDWQGPEDPTTTAAVSTRSSPRRARGPWQRELTVPVLTTALTATPETIPEDVAGPED